MKTYINKEQWIDEVANSLKSITMAKAPGGLEEKIMYRIHTTPQVRPLSIPVRKWAAAAILLLALNIGSIIRYASYHKNQNANTNSEFGMELLSESTYNY